MTSSALLFGLNYRGTSSALNGCINDTRNLGSWLRTQGYGNVKVVTDARQKSSTSKQGVVRLLQNLARASHAQRLDRVWISFSCHGTSVRDLNHDERDGKDEAIVCSDFKYLTDDEMIRILASFYEGTKVTLLMDLCHSGTVCDLSRKYLSRRRFETISNRKCPANVICMSGCMDNQTSSDAFDVNGHREYTGALTSCFLQAVRGRNNLLSDSLQLLAQVRLLLKRKGFSQVPQLTSSYDISTNKSFL